MDSCMLHSLLLVSSDDCGLILTEFLYFRRWYRYESPLLLSDGCTSFSG